MRTFIQRRKTSTHPVFSCYECRDVATCCEIREGGPLVCFELLPSRFHVLQEKKRNSAKDDPNETLFLFIQTYSRPNKGFRMAVLLVRIGEPRREGCGSQHGEEIPVAHTELLNILMSAKLLLIAPEL